MKRVVLTANHISIDEVPCCRKIVGMIEHAFILVLLLRRILARRHYHLPSQLKVEVQTLRNYCEDVASIYGKGGIC